MDTAYRKRGLLAHKIMKRRAVVAIEFIIMVLISVAIAAILLAFIEIMSRPIIKIGDIVCKQYMIECYRHITPMKF